MEMGKRVVVALLLGLAVVSLSADEGQSLKSIMQQLGQDINGLNGAILVEDYGEVARLARAIAEHPRPPIEERKQILAVLGEDAARFRATDQRVHEAAEALEKAAANQEMLQVLHFYHRLMQGCVACHGEFRPRLARPAGSE